MNANCSLRNIYLSLGGNLGDRLKNISYAVDLISEYIAEPKLVSSVYMSEPWGFEHAKYFTNIVVKLESNIKCDDLLTNIHRIEAELKRTRLGQVGYQGRTMDIDILYYGNQIIENEKLQIPHPRLYERLFVLLPLKEIETNFYDFSVDKNIDTMLAECKDKSKIRRL